LQPLEEVGYRTLMRLQADLGDRAGAVSTYHHCASLLERDLGVVPDPATRQAFQRLMARAGPASGRQAGAAGRSGLAAAHLVGRSRELGRLQDLWRAAAAGSRGLAVVRGGAGVRKTRLGTEIAGQEITPVLRDGPGGVREGPVVVTARRRRQGGLALDVEDAQVDPASPGVAPAQVGRGHHERRLIRQDLPQLVQFPAQVGQGLRVGRVRPEQAGDPLPGLR